MSPSVLLKVLLLCCLLFFPGTSLFAQEPCLRHFSTRDGLPSDIIYHIYPDSKGFIWFCTAQGISCYDGRQFRNYGINEGLPDNEIFWMREDCLGRHWMIGYNRKACYYQDGKIWSGANDPICSLIDKMNLGYRSSFLGTDSAWQVLQRYIFANPKEGIVRQILGRNRQSNVFYFTTFDGCDYLVASAKAYMIRNGHLRKCHALPPGNAFASAGHKDRIYQAGGLHGLDSIYSYTLQKDSIRIDRRDALPAYCYEMKYESDTSILCLTTKGAYFYQQQKGTFQRCFRYSDRKIFTHMVSDAQGNIWFSTLDDGVYMQGRQPTFIYGKANGLPDRAVLTICPQQNGMLAACYSNGAFSLIGQGQVRTFYTPQSDGVNRIKFAYRLKNERLIVGGDRGLYLIGPQGASSTILTKTPQKACFQLGGRCYIAEATGSFCYEEATGRLGLLGTNRTTAIATQEGARIWLGTLNGLYIREGSGIRKFSRDSVLDNNRIVRLAYAGSHYLVIATHRSGIYTWNGHRLRHIDRTTGMASDNCMALATDTSGAVWALSERGLDKIVPASGNGFSVQHYTVLDGLPAGQINDIACHKGQLHLATNDGIMVLRNSPAPASRQSAPDVYILSATLGDSVINWPKSRIILPHHKNNIQFSYTGVMPADGAGLRYRYVLRGGSGDTVYTPEDNLNLSNLKPGDYTLQLWARHWASPYWSRRPATFAFRITPPFWLTLWFAGACAIILGTITFLLYLAKIRSVQRKNKAAAEQQQQMAMLKMQALRSQINPHFMFNALNSIQHFYTQHEDRQANRYMALFSRLIRRALDHSERHWLTLAEELEALTSYIELERMRFENAFSFVLDMDPAIDSRATPIPAMLLQPYIENAIGHGLLGLRDRAGILRLTIRQQHRTLVCSIEDNGIGMQASTGRRPHSHTSFGMKLTRQRIDTLNALYHTAINVSVIDPRATDPARQGTLIVLTIPIRNYHE